MTQKLMKLIDARTGLMECRNCGQRHHATINPGGKYRRGSWQCPSGCRSAERIEDDLKAE